MKQHGKPMEHLLKTIEDLLKSYRQPMENHGETMGKLCMTYRKTMEHEWTTHGKAMEHMWKTHVKPMENLWKTSEQPVACNLLTAAVSLHVRMYKYVCINAILRGVAGWWNPCGNLFI